MNYDADWRLVAGIRIAAMNVAKERSAQYAAVCRYLRGENEDLRGEVERLEGENNEMRIWLYANKVKWPREVSNVQT